MGKPPKVLLASERPLTGLLWNLRLQTKNLTLITESKLSEVVARCQQEVPDLIVLDLPPLDQKGIDLICNLHETQPAPLLVLLSIRDTDSELKVYEAGADDCIVKPIEPAIFLAKINSWLKRVTTSSVELLDPLRAGKVYLTPVERVASLDNGCIVRLTDTETRLLYVLMSRAGRTIPADDLIQRVWKEKEEVGGDILKSMIYRLRQKLEEEPANLPCIVTVAGVGYKFDPAAQSRSGKVRERAR